MVSTGKARGEDRIDWITFAGRLLSRVTRGDSWFNPYTGFGTARDKTSQASFDTGVMRIPDNELAALYRGDPIARKVVALIPREMLRQGFCLKRTKEDGKDDELKPTEELLKALGATTAIRAGMTWGRLFGGALLFIGAEDGRPTNLPLDVTKVKRVSFLQVYDRRRIEVRRRYADESKGNLGEPEVYVIRSLDGGTVGDDAGIHESRCIRFGGADTDEEARRELDGWDDSVLQVTYDSIRQFHGNNKSAELMMTEASQGVFKIAGLIKALAAGDFETVQRRLIAADMGRSTARSVVVDAEKGEDFVKVATAFSGIGDMLDRSANYTAAASEIPVTVLMGQAPAGLNATGESDIRLLYDRVASERPTELTPVVLRLVEVLRAGDIEGIEVVYPSLWQESPKEKAERQKAEAERDNIYMMAGAVTEDEVALSPHVLDAYPGLDVDSRRALMGEDAKGSSGELALTPTDQATIVTVNQGLKSMGLPPMVGPDGELTITAYKAKYAPVVAEAAAAESGTEGPAPAAPADGSMPFGAP